MRNMVGDDMAWMGWDGVKVTNRNLQAYGEREIFLHERMYDGDDLGGRISLFLIDRFFFTFSHCFMFGVWA